MSITAGVDLVPATTVTDRYHPLRVKGVVAETAEAMSIVFDVPDELAETFRHVPGQFVTLRVNVDGERLFRSYSMSSTPGVDDDLQVTVKQVPGGVVSNWLKDSLREGDVLEVSSPAGVFVLHDTEDDLVALAAGSGITPVFSLVKAALHHTPRTVRLLFANRERSAAIFGDALDDLADRFPGRLFIEHHEDVARGFLTGADIARFIDGAAAGDWYLCGPGPFMDLAETTLREHDVAAERIHVERFTPATAPAGGADAGGGLGAEVAASEVVITLGRETKTIVQRGRATILQSARSADLRAPSSCEAGHCATCMARVVEGRVEMANNEILTADEVDEGWVLTCQSVPASPIVRVVYE